MKPFFFMLCVENDSSAGPKNVGDCIGPKKTLEIAFRMLIKLAQQAAVKPPQRMRDAAGAVTCSCVWGTAGAGHARLQLKRVTTRGAVDQRPEPNKVSKGRGLKFSTLIHV